MVYGITPCPECVTRMRALCLGLRPFGHVPEGIAIQFACMTFLGLIFICGFRVIQRNSDVPPITPEALQELLERDFHAPLIIAQVPLEEEVNSDDDSDDSDNE